MPDERTPETEWLPEPESIISRFTLHPSTDIFASAARESGVEGAVRRRSYEVIVSNEADPYDDPAPPAEVLLGIEAAAFAARGDAYSGKSRKAAKTSIADADVERFEDLRALTASLHSEEHMMSLRPPITTEPESDRREEENRNVRLDAFLFAASREDDNDFHLIIGTDPDAGRLLCMNVEVSGLPPESSDAFRTLKRVRDVYKAFFNGRLPGERYEFYPQRIPITIQGSLFFDVNHVTGGRPGPEKLRRFIPTVWEIHPITELIFEPES